MIIITMIIIMMIVIVIVNKLRKKKRNDKEFVNHSRKNFNEKKGKKKQMFRIIKEESK